MLSKPNAEKRRTDIPLPTVQNSHIIITATLQNYYEFVTKINIHFKKQNIRAVYFLPMFTLCSNKGLRMHYKRLHPLRLIKKRRSVKAHPVSYSASTGLSEIVSCRKVHTVGIESFVIKVHAPSVQVFDTKLHIVGYIIEDVGRKILPLTVSSGIDGCITAA